MNSADEVRVCLGIGSVGEEGPQAAPWRRPRGCNQRRVPRPRQPQAGQHDPGPDQVGLQLHLRFCSS